MKAIFLTIPVLTSLLLGSFLVSSASAQFPSGGVDKEGSWYAGEGLKHGDFFHYKMCHVDHKECSPFELEMWIEGDISSGSETKWIAQVAVFDSNKIIVGEMELGKVAPEPTGGSEALSVYRSAFKSSIVWLSAFATSVDSSDDKGPKEFSAISWGKIANIGGEQITPLTVETVTVPAGTWDTVQIGWKTGGATSKIWIADDFPFPIKAKTFTHVSSGIPPTEYEFTLLEYKENVLVNPITYTPTKEAFVAQNCDTSFNKSVGVKKPTNNFNYQVHVFYGPEDLTQNCESEWLIKFIKKEDSNEFLNQVQFDFLVVDENSTPIRSIAQEEGKKFLYSESGLYDLDIIIREDPGTANYVVWIYGLAPKNVVPSSPDDYLQIPVTIYAGDGTVAAPMAIPIPSQPAVPLTPSTSMTPENKIPSWIKTNAGWWASGQIDDESFVQAIQYLIKQEVLKIPQTMLEGSSGDSSNKIPAWIKTNAGWWASGQIDDASFVQAIQYLIKNGILNISS